VIARRDLLDVISTIDLAEGERDEIAGTQPPQKASRKHAVDAIATDPIHGERAQPIDERTAEPGEAVEGVAVANDEEPGVLR
jgi:hypothetical protein